MPLQAIQPVMHFCSNVYCNEKGYKGKTWPGMRRKQMYGRHPEIPADERLQVEVGRVVSFADEFKFVGQ